MNIAELMIAGLEQAGVTTAYGVPGEENTDLMLALEASRIDVVLTRHEQAAAFMASVHGRITGHPAVCFATLGPGATNLVTGVADATLDGVPLIAITGQGARSRARKARSHQIIDLESLFEPVAKLSHRLMDPEEVPGVLAEAIRVARAPRPGAVHLTLPEDLAAVQTTARPLPAAELPRIAAAPGMLVRALKSLAKAERPLIVAGAGVVRARAGGDLAEFAETANIPLVSTFMAKGILPADHPLHLHCIGQPFEDHVDPLLEHRDLVIAVGFDAEELAPEAITADGAVPVLNIAEIPAGAEHGWHVACDLIGEIGCSLRGLTKGLSGRRWPDDPAVARVRDRILAQRSRHSGTEGQGRGMHPATVMARVEEALQRDTLVLSGVGTHKMEVARYLAATWPGQVLIPNGLAGMGFALPGAIAAARLGHHGRVLAICGDGEFLMNLQEMETATRLGVSLTLLLLEDCGYGLIEAKQKDDAGRHTDLSFGNPDWDALVKAFGWTHRRVTGSDGLAQALADHTVGLNLITLPIDYSEALQRDGARPEAAE